MLGQTPRVFGDQDSAQLHALGGGTRLFDNLLKGFTGDRDQKNAGLKAVTLIATLNPVSQVLW